MALKNLKKGNLLDYIEQDVNYADFVDGGAAVGTLVLDGVIPAGAYFLACQVTHLVGFAGDTSCTLTVGDGTDADRYNTGTPSIFASANAAVMGVPSGTREHTATKNVTLTATSGSDWGAVTAGSFRIRLVFLV